MRACAQKKPDSMCATFGRGRGVHLVAATIKVESRLLAHHDGHLVMAFGGLIWVPEVAYQMLGFLCMGTGKG